MGQVTRHVPPEPGVTEIRVHGVGGTAPEALLEQTGMGAARRAAGLGDRQKQALLDALS